MADLTLSYPKEFIDRHWMDGKTKTRFNSTGPVIPPREHYHHNHTLFFSFVLSFCYRDRIIRNIITLQFASLLIPSASVRLGYVPHSKLASCR